MALSTETVRYLHQISRQQQKFMEQLDTLIIGVLSGPPERLLLEVDKTPSHPVRGPESDPISGQQDSGPI